MKALRLIKAMVALPVIFAMAVTIARATPVGYLVGYAVHESGVPGSYSYNSNTNTIQLPLFAPYERDNQQWWSNMVSEAAFANVAFVALCDRGQGNLKYSPLPTLNGVQCSGYNGDAPSSYAANAVTAISQRGLQGVVSLALFDDTGAYPGTLALDTGNQITTFDLSNTSYWATYWWNYKWLPYFQNVPDAYRMKIDGRPLVFIWSVASGLGYTNQSGHLSGLISYLRYQCENTPGLGFNPFIVVDSSWTQLDSSVASNVDGVDGWYAAPSSSWSRITNNGASGTFTTGVVNAGYWVAANPSKFINRYGGYTFSTGLSNTVNSANLVLIEGLTDIEENAAHYRGETAIASPAVGAPSGQTWYNANQFFNILRPYTQPGTSYTVFEAEGCDYFSTPSFSSGNGMFRRDGNMNLSYTDGTQSNWAVTLNPGEWLQYISFTFAGASNYKIDSIYSSTAAATMELLIDGSVVATVNLPSTGGGYSYYLYQTTFPITAGAHTIEYMLVSGQITLDNWGIGYGY